MERTKEKRSKQKWGKKIISFLIILSMLCTLFNTMAFGDTVPLEKEPTSKLDYITAEAIFDKIKGSNESMDNITSDLVYYGSDSSLDFYGKIDESGKISWKTSSFSSEGHDVRLTWKSSSDPEYIDVSNSRNFSLKKRPELAKGEEDKAVTIKVEAYDCETYQTKNVDLNLIIKAGDYIKTPYDYVEENIFDLIKGENLDKSNIKTDLVDYNGSAKEGNAFFGKIVDGNFSFTDNRYNCSVMIEWVSSSDPDYIDVKKGSRALKLKKRPEGSEPAKDVILTLNVTPLQLSSGTKRQMEIPLTILNGDHIDTPFEIVKAQLFNAIKGNNVDAENIIESLVLPCSKNPCYAAIKEGNKVEWKSAKYYPHNVKVEFKGSSQPEIIKVESNKLELVKRPTEDTKVDLEIELTDKEDHSITEIYTMPLVIKGVKSEINPLDGITPEILFDAIKGNNDTADNITSSLVLPANDANPF